MRVDANISLRPYGQEKFGTKTELAPRSFSNVRGSRIRVQRQAEILRLRWSIHKKHAVTMKPTATILMRVKVCRLPLLPRTRPPLFEISDEIGLRMRTERRVSKERRAHTLLTWLVRHDASQLTANKVTSDFFEKEAVALNWRWQTEVS